MRVVIIGHGMVASRLVSDLCRGPAPADLSITVIGAEPHAPYNRVLLGEVLAGRADLAGLGLPDTHSDRVRVLTAVHCVRIDRHARQVHDDRGEVHGYDHLVLATGADAVTPPGLDGMGAHLLRSLDDVQAVLVASSGATSAAVVGAGVLGIEIACALAGRGLRTTLVGRGAVFDRHVEQVAGAALTTALHHLDVAVVHGEQITAGTGPAGRGLRVDGQHVPAELVVLACGTRPRTALAEQAGLHVDRGIVVDDQLDCPRDRRIHALGDCAQPPEGGSGLVAQGWDQARRLAARLRSLATGGASYPPASWSPGPASGAHQQLVRVKADGLVAVAMGQSGPNTPVHSRKVSLVDCDAGRYVEAVVDGDQLIGAVCIGDPALAADLTVRFTRGTPLPIDPAQLLIRPVVGMGGPATEASLTKLPNRATVCRCNSVTKGDIVTCWKAGARTVGEVADQTRATTGCGTCADTVRDILDWVSRAETEPIAQRATAGL